jgi:hypothetical protein
MSTNQKFAHKLLVETAKEFAGAFYEEAAQDNEFYKFYPNQRFFIRREHKRFIEAARLQLSKMLGMSTTPEWQKEEIFEALIKHAAMPGNIDKRVAQKMIDNGDVPDVPSTVIN